VTTPDAVNRSEVPVAAMMQSVLAELQPEIMVAGAAMNVTCAEGMKISGDREMLRTVVVALLSNSLKFRDKAIAPVVQVSFERWLSGWSMTVEDNGVGVDERFAPRMFEMFARFHPVGEHPGAGVGLALSKRIVDCHGGKMTVRPSTGAQGSVFRVEMPIGPPSLRNPLDTARFPY
jgi:light-regulated signal transduction histidine kinase (bacteriophytochrome)